MSDIPFFKTPSYGGSGGAAWDDAQVLATIPPVGFKAMAVRWDQYVNALLPTYELSNGNTYMPGHGSETGSLDEFRFEANEQLIGIQGGSGDDVDRLGFVTALTYGGGDPPTVKTYGPYGGSTGKDFQIWGEIIAFYGRSNSLLNAIGCYLSTTTAGPFGGTGGSPFQDPGPIPDLTSIIQIVIWSGDTINAIGTTYKLPDGTSQTFTHGGNSGTEHVIVFNPGERIIAVVGRSGTELDNIALLTEDWAGVRRTYGPYGGEGGTQFIVNADVNGFFGRSGSRIDAIGFFTS